jgi:hypothetical protein
MSIKLVGIVELGNNRYRLDFQDGATSVSFVLERVRRNTVALNREFNDYFRGRTSGRDAYDALLKFACGEHVAFPVEVREDGFRGMGR